MLGDVHMSDAPPSVVDDEEAIEHTERDRRNSKEVHGGDCFPMIAQKGKPTFGPFRISWCLAHPAGDGSFGNVKAKHEKLTVNTRCAPGRVLRNHPIDQIANFLGNASSADRLAGPGNCPPIKRKPIPVPSHDGFRAHHDQSLFPLGPEFARENPERLIEHCQSWFWMPSRQRRELLTKGQVLKKKATTSAEEPNKRTGQQSNSIYHPRVLSHFACGLQPCFRVQTESKRSQFEGRALRVSDAVST